MTPGWEQHTKAARRAGFWNKRMETMSRTLVRATLNGRWEMNDAADPKFLLRESDLHFVSGPASELLDHSGFMTGHALFFQAPNGYTGPDDRDATATTEKAEYDTLPGLLNAWGYFVEFGEDPAKLPAFISGERRALGLASKRH